MYNRPLILAALSASLAASVAALTLLRPRRVRRNGPAGPGPFSRLAGDLQCVVGWDGSLRQMNLPLQRLLGPAGREPSGGLLTDLAHPDDAEEVAATLERLRGGADGDVLDFEARFRRKDGAFRWLRVNASPDPERRVHCLAAQDVTERREAEEELRHVLTGARCVLWHAAVEEVGTPNLFWDTRLWDEADAERFFPVEKPPGVGYAHAWYLSRLDGDRERSDAYGTAQVRANRSYSQEFRCRTKDGQVRWLKEDVRVEQVGPGRWRTVGVCTDITERRETEEALRSGEARFRAVFENSMDAIGVSTRGAILSCNQAFVNLFGFDREAEVVGRPVESLIAPSEQQAIAARNRLREAGEAVPTVYETRGLRRDATEFPMKRASPRTGRAASPIPS